MQLDSTSRERQANAAILAANVGILLHRPSHFRTAPWRDHRRAQMAVEAYDALQNHIGAAGSISGLRG